LPNRRFEQTARSGIVMKALSRCSSATRSTVCFESQLP